MGPNEKRLAITKFTKDAIPAGGGFTDGLRAIIDPDMPQKIKEAALWVKEALDIIMAAPDCLYKDREEAAQAVLNKM